MPTLTRAPVLDPPIKLARASLALTLLTTAALGTAACHRAAISPPAPSPTLPAPNDDVRTAEPPPGVGMNGITRPVMQLMGEERSSRPTGTPSAQAVFAAAKQAGVPTSDAAQVLARLLGASYCENARTARGVVLSVCEFKDVDTLTRGKAYSQRTFARPLPNRTLLANRKTLLTINPPDDTPAVRTEVEAIAGAFARL